MTIEQACQAEQEKYGNVAIWYSSECIIGQVLDPRSLLDLSGPVVVVGITNQEDWKKRSAEFGIPSNGRVGMKFYLVRSE
jgi:hypothetical protein